MWKKIQGALLSQEAQEKVVESFDSKSSYKQSFKATTIFGGVQVILIIVAIVKSKFVAILLGASGVGIIGLLTSTTSMINTLTSFGLSTSAVKQVSAAFVSGNDEKIGRAVEVVKRLMWVTGTGGFLLTLIMAPWLSRLAFGNSDYTYAFMALSVAALIGQLSAGKEIILRSARKVELLSRATVFGALIGLVSSVMLYYYLGEQGIVPAIIVTTVTAFVLYWIFSQQVKLPVQKLNRAVLFTEGMDMMKMGSLISLTGLLTLGTAYVVQLYVSHTGGVAQVGLFTAGFAIINTYVGMIFTAMGTDYFPRLSGVADKKEERNTIVNQQIEIAILLLTPVITAFIVYVNLVVLILYAASFIAINDMILWAALGMFFKAASWAIAFMFLAKGESKLFFWNELIANAYLLVLNIAGYTVFGLTGLGISFMATYLIYACQVYIIARRKFQFELQPVLIRSFSFQLLLAVTCFVIMKYLPNPLNYLLGTMIILVAGWHTFRELDKRMNLKPYLQKLIGR